MKLIDKDALVAEIERRKQVALGWMETAPNEAVEAESELCDDILSFIDNLEIKEVDLESEMDKFYGIYRKNGITYDKSDNEVCFDWKDDELSEHEIRLVRHFFKLGLKAQNKITISQQRLSVLKMEFWTGLETFNASEMTLSDAYNKGIEDVLEELDIEKV